MLSTTVNSLTCVFISILVTLCAGDPDLLTGDLALSGHPLAFIIQLLFDAARERREPATAVFVLCAILFGVCTINTTTTSSRMLFSLVRDGRDPYITKILAKVSPYWVPPDRKPGFSVCLLSVGLRKQRPPAQMRCGRVDLACGHSVDQLRLSSGIFGDSVTGGNVARDHVLSGLCLFAGLQH